MSSSQAATLTNVWSGMCYCTPLLGAFLAGGWRACPLAQQGAVPRGVSCPLLTPAASNLPPSLPDAYWGRYKVIVSASVIYLCGLIMLVLSAALPSLKPTAGEGANSQSQGLFWTGMGEQPEGHGSMLDHTEACCFSCLLPLTDINGCCGRSKAPTHLPAWSAPTLPAGMYCVALGEGGIKPTVLPLGAGTADRQNLMVTLPPPGRCRLLPPPRRCRLLPPLPGRRHVQINSTKRTPARPARPPPSSLGATPQCEGPCCGWAGGQAGVSGGDAAAHARAPLPLLLLWLCCAAPHMSSNLGTLITLTLVVNIETGVSWAAGFSVIAGAFLCATVVFLIGTPLYRQAQAVCCPAWLHLGGSLESGARGRSPPFAFCPSPRSRRHWPPGGSPLTRIWRVSVAAFKHRKAEVRAGQAEEGLTRTWKC